MHHKFKPYLESVFLSFLPFFFHEKAGAGSPDAWQANTAIPPDFTEWDTGGFVISGGSRVKEILS